MVSEKKQQFVQKLTEQLKETPVIALVDMQNLPTQQLQNIRAQLHQKNIGIVMARKKLLNLSLANSQKPNMDLLAHKIKGMPALLLSQENPFTLCSILQKNKSIAPAKANQIAPQDIVVPAGATNFAPGPIISELASVGIKTKVDKGKLAIVQDTTVAKEGEAISLKLSEILKRLDIKPMEIGLNLVAAWENGLVFDAKQLHLDETEYYNNIVSAFQEGFNLSVEIVYLTAENTELLLQKAFRNSKNLALDLKVITDATASEILGEVERQALEIKEAAHLEIPAVKAEVKPSPAEKMVKAIQEHFTPKIEKEEEPDVLSAEELVEEERKASGMERRRSKEAKEAERLFEELKKEGTLRS